MRRITTCLSALSEYRVPISMLAVAVIVSNIIVAVVFTGYYSSPKTTTTPLVSTKQVSIDDREYEILTNAQGQTLYYFYFLGTDIAKTVCTGGCITTWHPLLMTDPSTIMAVKPELRGQLTAAATTNGLQVQYNGRFLYTYSGDTVPGQMNGSGHSVGVGIMPETAVYSSISNANHITENASIPMVSATHTFIHGLGYEILTNAQGQTLYYPEEGDVCTGKCTTTWHPLLIADPSALMIVSPALRDLLAAVPSPNGLQVQYIGHPLYTYSGDTLPSEVNGLAEGGSWTVAH